MGFYVLCKSIYTKNRPQTNKRNIQTAGASYRKRSQTPVCPMTGNNNFTMSSISQSRSTRHQRSTSAIACKRSRGRTTQAHKNNHAQFDCYALWIWKPMQIHQSRCSVIKALQAKNLTSIRIQHWRQLLNKRSMQTRKNTITVTQLTLNQCIHQKFWFNRQGLP